MIAMEKKCNFRKGFFAVLVAASAVVGCSKSNNHEPVTPPTPADLGSYYMELTTEKIIGEKVNLYIGADKADEAEVWLDLNSNGKWDEGIDQKPTSLDKSMEYTLLAQKFRIYGKVKKLNCESNLLSAIDISHNPALTELYAKDNNLPSIARLEFLKTLKIDSHTLKNSHLPKGLIYLNVNKTTPLAAIDTSLFTELESLVIFNFKSIKSLDLSKNQKLTSLHIDGTGLTTLDLSHQPQLENLYASGTPLTKLNVAGNTALKVVNIELTEEGDGIQGEALMDFINQLPTREEGKEGQIFLSPDQVTEEVKELLEGKKWKAFSEN